MDGLGVFDDGAVFLERGGGAVEQWFLDSLDMNGIRAAYRAVKIKHHHLFVWEVRQF